MEKFNTITGPRDGETFTATTFLQYIRRSSPHWWSDDQRSSECSWVFRGQKNETLSLTPSAARQTFNDSNKFNTIIEALRTNLEPHDAWQRYREYPIFQDIILRYWALASSIEKFKRLAGELEYNTTSAQAIHYQIEQWIGGTSIHKSESQRNIGFSKVSSSLLRGTLGTYTKVDYRKDPAVALAQHHGIPTFLLDWTSNPIVAGFFAAQRDAKPEDASGLAIWAFNIGAFQRPSTRHNINKNPAHPSSIGILYPPKATDKYLSSQSGILTYIENPELRWLKNGQYPPMESIIELYSDDLTEEPFLRKVILPVAEISKFRQLLYREGITRAHMMPTLDNIASTAMDVLSNECQT